MELTSDSERFILGGQTLVKVALHNRDCIARLAWHPNHSRAHASTSSSVKSLSLWVRSRLKC